MLIIKPWGITISCSLYYSLQLHNEKVDLERNKLLFPSSTENNIQIQMHAILPDCKKKKL